MPWICPCSATEPDEAHYCSLCGQPRPNQFPVAKPSGNGAWKMLAVVGVVVVGAISGTAVAAFGGHTAGGNAATATTSKRAPARSAFQDSFDASFKASCQESAMRTPNVTRATAENYCSCALPIVHDTHNLMKAATSCQKYLVH